ncbi:TIM barrel protein [Methanococcoides sp. SA1]|nr:TIM barrel protein [Methanococcoides sp. SA1]
MSVIRFGPGGLGGVKEACDNLERFAELGLKACEVEFVRGVYIKKKEDALRIGECAKKFGIVLSIHAPYYINLNSSPETIEKSKERIVNCCEAASWLGARRVVFHAGFYMKSSPEEAYEKIKEGVLDVMARVKEKGFDVEVCPELMGKVNVFGSISEVSKLVEETGCGVCIDVAHVLARYGKYELKRIEEAFPQNKWHVHFSGIEYGEKGEKRHLDTGLEEWEKVLGWLSGLDKDIVLICEAPDPISDSKAGLQIWEKLNR